MRTITLTEIEIEAAARRLGELKSVQVLTPVELALLSRLRRALVTPEYDRELSTSSPDQLEFNFGDV